MKNYTILIFFLFTVNSFSLKSQIDTIQCKSDAWVWSIPQARDINFGVANSNNSGLNNVLRAECWQWRAGKDDTIRSFVDFDLSAYSKTDISSAYLDLKHFSNPNFTQQVGQNAFEIFRINDQWQENIINWTNQPNYDTSLVVSGLASSTNTQDYFIDVTSLVHSIIDSGGQGFILKMKDEQSFKGLSFASRENQNNLLRPKLIIHGPNGGLSDQQNPITQIYVINPFGEKLKIKGASPFTQMVIQDLNGKTLYDGLVGNGTIPSDTWSRGLYIVTINGTQIRALKSK